MNREELEKEIEDKGVEYADKQERTISIHEDSGYSWGQVEQAYEKGALDFAEPREEQIEQLKQENTALRQDWSVMKSTITLYENENTELKEKLKCTEKARDYWKDSSFDWRHKCTSRRPFKAAVKAQKQLSKAKALLAKWVELYKPKLEDFPKPPIQVDTEQFLSEVEE